MSRRTAAGLALVMLALTAGTAASADAAVTGTFPATTESRTFATTNGGWTSQVDYGSLVCVPGVTCPVATPSYRTTGGTGGAADGHLRDTFGTLLGVLSTTTINWTSPSFVSPVADGATLKFHVRPQIASLLAIGNVKVDVKLIDVADATRTTTLSSSPLTAASASFSQKQIDVPSGILVEGRSYQLRIGVSHTSTVSAVTSGNVDLDNVVLETFTSDSPSNLTASFPASGTPRIAGAVDPKLGSADVVVQYGPTSAYGTSTAPVAVTGVGAKSYAIPLADLTSGATYHYRVVATNTSGSSATSDATFVAPSPPADTAPTVAGAGSSRARTVTFARDSGTASATVQVLGADGSTVLDTVADGDDDGQVAVVLPDADGTYGLRVVRTSPHGLSSTSAAVDASLDRTAPSTAALGLAVTPRAARGTSRTVAFTRPADAQTVTAQVVDAGNNAVGAPVTVVGGSAGVTLGSADGTYRVRLTLTDAVGNGVSVTSQALSVDTSAPAKVLVGEAPAALTNSSAVRVPFTMEPDATAECRLDGGQWSACPSPFTAGGLADGGHTLELRQTDAAGNVGAVERLAWTVDTTTPAAPEIGSAPESTTTATDATIVFSGNAGATFEHALDGGAWAPATSPLTLRGLAVGTHVVKLRQVNAAGTPGAAREVTWTVKAAASTQSAPSAPPSTPSAPPAEAKTPADPATTAAARVMVTTVNGERATGSPSAAPTVTVTQQTVGVGCRTAGVDLKTCAVKLYAVLVADGHAVTAASRRVLVGSGRTEASTMSRKLAVRVALNATGRRLLAGTSAGLRVQVAITATPSVGEPIRKLTNANLVARRVTVVVSGFAVNEAVLPAAARRQLRGVARRLAAGATVRVTGHTDSSTSDEAFLDELGLRRARTVRRFLAANGAKAGWTVDSRGDREPVKSNRTPAGRAENRRVVLRITL